MEVINDKTPKGVFHPIFLRNYLKSYGPEQMVFQLFFYRQIYNSLMISRK